MPKILVVDDEQEIVNILFEFLSKKGYELVTALGGKNAIEVIKSDTAVDLMIVDLKMPDVNGITVLNEMKKMNRDIPVIILSGSLGIEKYIDDLTNLGYSHSDVLYKPIDLNVILDAIKKIRLTKTKPKRL